MHIMFSVLGAVSALAYYWYVLRDAGNAIEKLTDAAGHARGGYRRRQFRRMAEASTIRAINDPRTAAVVMAVSLAGTKGELTAGQDRILRRAMTDVLNVGDPEAELIFAKWAVQSVRGPIDVARQLRSLWTSNLSYPERLQLIELLCQVVTADGAILPDQARCISKLRAWLNVSG